MFKHKMSLQMVTYKWIFNPTKILISIWFSQWVMGTFPALSPFAPSEE